MINVDAQEVFHKMVKACRFVGEFGSVSVFLTIIG